MLAYDGTIYQVLLSSTSSTTIANVRRAIWSGNRMISKPPTISNISSFPSCGQHVYLSTTSTKNSTTANPMLRLPAAAACVADTSRGRPILLVADVVRSKENQKQYVLVYQLRPSTKKISLLVELPLPSTTVTSIQITEGPTISCIGNGKVYIYTPNRIVEIRNAVCSDHNLGEKHFRNFKDYDASVAIEEPSEIVSERRQWHQTTYRPRFGQFFKVPVTGQGPLLYQEITGRTTDATTVNAETENDGDTETVLGRLVVGISTELAINSSNNSSRNQTQERIVIKVANNLQTWCSRSRESIDCAAYGVSPKTMCVATTLQRFDGIVTHQLQEIVLNSRNGRLKNVVNESLKTTTGLPCRPMSMMITTTTTATPLAVILQLSVDLHPDIPRTVLLNNSLKRKGSLNVVSTFNSIMAMFR
jgi:hypothetical protein